MFGKNKNPYRHLSGRDIERIHNSLTELLVSLPNSKPLQQRRKSIEARLQLLSEVEREQNIKRAREARLQSLARVAAHKAKRCLLLAKGN
jgi:hypothetical protein